MEIHELHGVSLHPKIGYRECFYVKEDDGKYWLGHQHNKTGDNHETRITKEFYEAFLKEHAHNRAKQTMMLKDVI